ncbi:MAG: IMP cyclohydrolase [Desulfocapsaceae bacterium]|jgi:phosphoribosylaminoimidazolecarboxamide formyltransferase/IMP cyclohydrolase
MNKITRALISLTDKSGIEEFATALAELDIELLSTGGTAARLRRAGLKVVDVSDFTGFPEMLNGRVKTLHPKIHGGILFQRENQQHIEQCRAQNVQPVDLVVVNLYEFEKTIADPSCTLGNAVENIDIGGPTLLRASAKNFRDVTVIVDPVDYDQVLSEIRQTGNTSLKTRFLLARKVFDMTSKYDRAISQWLGKIDPEMNEYFQEG